VARTAAASNALAVFRAFSRSRFPGVAFDGADVGVLRIMDGVVAGRNGICAAGWQPLTKLRFRLGSHLQPCLKKGNPDCMDMG
jgi:hypothetical protein